MQNSQGRTQGKPARGNALESRVARQPVQPGPQAARRSQRGLLRGFFLASAIAVTASAAKGQLSTQDHLSEPGFWPTQEQSSRAEFVGAEVCARCHAMKTATQKETPMAKNLALAQDAEILHAHPAMAFSANKFEYRIDTDQKQSTFSIAGEGERLSYPLLWAFGTGRVAQSYLFKQQDGKFYEARASYFTNLHDLDFTPARALASASSIEQAMYRPVPMDEVRRCFACHATAANVGGVFDEQHLIPGVGCEACHGPGAGHVKLMDNRAAKGSGAGKSAIFNPGDLLAADAVDFCGACHGTWWDTKLSGVKGASAARSAPYRLVTSKCWGTGDARLACAACHDPHRQLQTDASDYDPICLSCHVSGTGEKPTSSHPGAACPKATRKCTDCHMEKVHVPEMHANFTDHRIRIAHPGEPFPE
jgi:cytochrome c553